MSGIPRTKMYYPWTDKKRFTGDKDLLPFIMEDLKKRLPPAAFAPILSRELKKLCINLCQDVLNRVDNESCYPWVVALSPSSDILQTFATTVPAILALTKYLKPMVVSSGEVLAAVRHPAPRDVFEDDSPGEFLHQLKNCGVLVWKDFPETLRGVKDYASIYVGLLSSRVRKQHPTIFLGRFVKGRGNFQDTTIERIRSGYGDSVSEMVRELALIKSFGLPSGREQCPD